MVTVGIIGVGYWGPNLVRVVSQSQQSTLKWCSDLNDDNLKKISKLYPSIKCTKDYHDMLADKEVDAIIISTPAFTHYKIAMDCLSNNKNVLIEKPMTYNSKECEDLIKVSKDKDKVLMVGHTFEYDPCINKLKEYVNDGLLGDIYYLYSTRVNLGVIRDDVNSMWNLAPHDVSILLYLLNKKPISVSARGHSYLKENNEDVVFIIVEFEGNIFAQIHVSWLDPTKVRRLTIVGNKKMVVFDDMDNEAKIKIYDKGVTKLSSKDGYGEYLFKLRAGDIHIPKIELSEPLKNEFLHFEDCIINHKVPRSDGEKGMQVVKILEAAQKSLDNRGEIISLI